MDILIGEYYAKHRENLHNLFINVEKNIQGRICHSSIILLKILCELEKIENYLEIGVHNGGSMGLLITNNNSKNLYGIDLFEDMYDVNKHLNKDKFVKYQYFKRDNLSKKKTADNLTLLMNKYNKKINLNLIQGNSYFDKTENEFNKVRNNITLDLLFIDGDHTLDGVKNDFERYNKYVKKGGFIIFDDYHHEIIQRYCDDLFLNNSSYELICKFKSYNSNAIDLLVKKIS